MGWIESLKSTLSEREKCLVSSFQKGRVPFIAERQVDNYKLFISLSTKGFIWLVGPILRRSVEGFHSVRTCSAVFQGPSYCSSGPPRQWGGQCSSRFLEWLLSEVFTWRQHLPLWSDEVDGLASPLHRPAVHSHILRGHGLPVRHCLVLSQWWLAIFVGGKEASWGVVIGWRFCPHWYLSMKYRIVKWVLTRQWLPHGKVMMLFRRVPQA
jgi:hypothetical protein